MFTATAHHEQVRARFLTRFEERRTGEDLTSGQVKSMSSDSRAQRTAMATSCMFCNTAFCLTRVAILNQAPNSGFLDDLQAVRGPVRRLERRSMPRKHGNKSIATAYYTAPDNAEISALVQQAAAVFGSLVLPHSFFFEKSGRRVCQI